MDLRPIPLDAGVIPPLGVAKPSRIDFYVGTPPRQMLIFTGVAIPEVVAQEEDLTDLVWAEVIVKLGAVTTENFLYTCTVGLASISNEDSDFNFFADESSVIAPKSTGELELHVPVGVSGEPSSLHRLTYHVQVLSDPVTSMISGTIRWADLYGQPSPDVLSGATPMFTVVAGHTVELPAQDPPGFRQFRWEGHAFGHSTAVPQNFGGTWAVPYVIKNVPLGVQFEVRPDPPAGHLINLPPGYLLPPSFNPGLRVVELTPAAPSAIGIDFDMLLVPEPK